MKRLQGSTWGTWQPGGGVLSTDPQTASSGNGIYAPAVDSSGAVWTNRFSIGTGNNWQGGREHLVAGYDRRPAAIGVI